MFSKIWQWIAAISSIVALAFVVLFEREKRKRLEDEHEDVQNAQLVERQDAKITAQGLTDEALTGDELKDISVTDYFKK